MRRLLMSIVCAGLLTTTQAQTIGQIITPTPVSLALTIGRWLAQDTKKLYYIEVESRAETFEQAKQDGFRLAVEHAVGSLLLSETEIRNGRLTRDDIITYSSGYVDRFEISRRENVGGGVIIIMKVWVAHSAISNRLLNQSTTAGTVDGERSATQLSTITESRQNGDRVLSAVLADYPAKSFDVKLDKTKVIYDQYRQGQLYISFYLSWNRNYLTSLAETIKTIQQSGCGIVGSCRATTWVTIRMPGFTSNVVAGFDDHRPWELFQQHTLSSHPSIMLTIKDFDGNQQFKQCFYTKELDHRDWNTWYYVEFGPGQVTVHGDKGRWLDTYINLQNLPVQKLDNVEVSIVRASECN